MARPALAKLTAAVLALAVYAPWAASAQLSQSDVLVYQAAFEAADLQAWATARAIERQASDPVLREVVDWVAMSNDAGDRSFAEIADFLGRHPDWPDQRGLRSQAERLMPAGLGRAEVLAYFEAHPPVTVDGTVRYAQALEGAGRLDEAQAMLHGIWPELTVSAQSQDDLLSAVGHLLTPTDHALRMDRLIWDGRLREARWLMPHVDAATRALAEARIQLANQADGVDALIAAVPAELQTNEGLLYERLRWRRRSDRIDGAIEILAQQPAQLTHPSAWWSERNIIARDLLTAGDTARAYQVASQHRQTDSFARSQAEWLSGWIALRFLNDPEAAFGHFQALYANVGTPISLGRGAYWSARALADLGRDAEAAQWYAVAAQNSSAFYGQLAATPIGQPTVGPLPPDPAADPAFAGSEFGRIIPALHQIGQDRRTELFFRAATQAAGTDPAALRAIADLADSLGLPHMGVYAVKQLIFENIVLYETGYPVIDLSTADPRVEGALVLALMRRESEFDAGAISPAGARGLMQLMPATAAGVAGQLGIAHNVGMLTSDPGHNIRLGSAYLASMLERFGGSYVLAIAAYNAGPSRVDNWLESLGDPRDPGIDVIDWLESVPIYETRNYVMRVLEDVQVYRVRLGNAPVVGGLEADLAR
ncbi:MAG: lytic transglycosylase domain-containing protein [Rhodospirillaceae bacterium]|nr:lytic transglycosylase domain-containing protein [Rhodospirillaceae bacterium]